MKNNRVFIATPCPKTRKNLRDLLFRYNYTCIGEAGQAGEALRLIRAQTPDLVILDSLLPGMDSLEVAAILEEDQISPVILLIPSWNQQLVMRAQRTWVFAFLVKPVTEQNLWPALETARASFVKIRERDEQIKALKDSLATRKWVEKAKGQMVENLKITENQAYERLRKYSMDQGLSLLKVAQRVLRYYEKRDKK